MDEAGLITIQHDLGCGMFFFETIPEKRFEEFLREC